MGHRSSQHTCFVSIFVAALLAAMATDCTLADTSMDEIRQQRKQAAHRKRRIVMDNDGNEPVYLMKKATAKALLDCRTTDLAGTQVDTIVYCTWSSGFSFFTHNTKVGEVFTCTAEGFSENKTKDLIAQGTDSLKIVTEFCRKNDIEVFWSMRMNDTHDAWNAWYSPYMVPKLKKDHPEWLVASKEKRSKVGGWTAVDYARPEIRDLAFQFVQEVCENYDVDGVVLDYFRHPVFFKAHAHGGVVGQEERDMLTDMMRRIRRMADEVGAKRGQPVLVTARVPDSVEYCNAIGLDIVRWMKDDLIDLLAVSGYFRLNPWRTSVELGHKYNVPVLACLSESRLKGDAGKIRKGLSCYRARAMNAWSAGVDGLYTFNFFDPKSSLWREIGDPKTIVPLDRMYCTGARGTKVVRRWVVNGDRFLNRDPVSPERPRPLAPDKPANINMVVGEQIVTNGPVDVALDLRIENLKDADLVSIAVNGETLPKGSIGDGWLHVPVDPKLVRKGANKIKVSTSVAANLVLQDLLMWIRPKHTP